MESVFHGNTYISILYSFAAGSIVDFFRNFTVDIVGVGDVCSFAQMDVRKHGNPAWAANAPPPPQSPDEEVNKHQIVLKILLEKLKDCWSWLRFF